MTIGKAKREFIAENLARSAEYILAILVLGQLISGKISLGLLLGSGIAFLGFMITAVIIYPSDSNEQDSQVS